MFKSNVDKFLTKYTKQAKSALDEIKDLGVENIKKETPVDSGTLQSSNDAERRGFKVLFYNTQEYAPYVELGTIYQNANPFMRRGVNKTKKQMDKVFKRKMSD